ncbi:extensin family protein [Histidinibacterium lentulum]|uniref:Extensin n=1 Tax=Histidinibacterium lentulum TaxID=2480588 RepID=A0A3N2R9J2_9RHOB|nr:extensin family protein [Histidinibacterium lentulum]ROU04132.1 extensin [Histidinibacterium lentulum]
MRALVLCSVLAAGPVAAQTETAPETSPAPPVRPAESLAEERPAPRITGEEEVTVADPPEMPDFRRVAAEPDVYAECLAALDALGTVYGERETIAEPDDRDCGIVNPVTVSQILPGVALSPPGPMRCETARALAEWTRDHVLPVTGRLPRRGALETLETGSTYVCRRRNNAEEGKPSEHSFGNAVDIMGMTFAEGPPLDIRLREGDGDLEEAAQRAIRGAACIHFATVLGPGTDASHEDHLHLDVVQRRGDFRLCQ